MTQALRQLIVCVNNQANDSQLAASYLKLCLAIGKHLLHLLKIDRFLYSSVGRQPGT